MRGQRDICLLCRHALRRPHPSTSARRWLASPAAEPYVLPRAVIDLDAAESKFVRKFEDLPEKERLEQLRVKEIKPKEKRPPKKKKQDFGFTHPKVALRVQTVTPPDLLQYALLGDPWGYSPGVSWLRLIFKRRAIQVQDDAAAKIQQLTHDFKPGTLRAAGLYKVGSKPIIEGLLASQTFPSLARQLTMLSTTDYGRRFLANKSNTVYDAIRKCRKQGFDKGTWEKVAEVKISEVVELLNNLTRNMTRRSVGAEVDLYNAGLYYASKASILPAIKMYLEIGFRHGYNPYWGFERAMRNLQSEYATGISPPTRWAAWKGNGQRRDEILKLITGWNSSDVSFREAIFSADYPVTQANAYKSYVLGIGEMGFSDALWEEWQSQPHFLADAGMGEVSIAQPFAMAFLLAKDRNRAMDVLASVQVHKIKHRLPQLFSKHYEFHHLIPSKKLLSKIANEGVHEDPRSALKFLEDMLVTDYPKFYPDAKLTLEWATREGKEGLLVMPLEGQDPIYWKPID